ncbi:MAG: efflux RND transporter periplasmic adaptor subunit [Acidobacteriota bacterium]
MHPADAEPDPRPVPSPRSPWNYALAGALATLVVVAGVAALWWPSPGGDGESQGGGVAEGGPAGPMGFGPPPVKVVAAVETIAAEPVELLGSVAALRDSLVASEVEGVVAEVRVDEGDEVAAGDLLARLRTTTVELQLAAAQAASKEAAARLVSYDAELRRMTDLLERQAVSQSEFDQAVADRDAQQQSVARNQADAERLQELINRASITAPFAGKVAAVHVEVGEWVSQGGDVVTLVDLSEVEVTVPIPERYVPSVQIGFPVEVRFDALPGRTYAGRVKALVPQAVPEARTFPLLIAVDNPGGHIQGGMVTRVSARVGEPSPTVLVPKDALVNRGGQSLLYRLRPRRPGSSDAGESSSPTDPAGAGTGDVETMIVEELTVRTGPALGTWQVVEGQVAGDDLVVVRGNESLRPGQSVKVIGRLEMEPPPTPSPNEPVAIAPRRGSLP